MEMPFLLSELLRCETRAIYRHAQAPDQTAPRAWAARPAKRTCTWHSPDHGLDCIDTVNTESLVDVMQRPLMSHAELLGVRKIDKFEVEKVVRLIGLQKGVENPKESNTKR